MSRWTLAAWCWVVGAIWVIVGEVSGGGFVEGFANGCATAWALAGGVALLTDASLYRKNRP